MHFIDSLATSLINSIREDHEILDSMTINFEITFLVCKGQDFAIYGPRSEKPFLQGFANNKGADQPVQSDQHLCYSLIGKYPI